MYKRLSSGQSQVAKGGSGIAIIVTKKILRFCAADSDSKESPPKDVKTRSGLQQERELAGLKY